jgi:hypothetical protein
VHGGGAGLHGAGAGQVQLADGFNVPVVSFRTVVHSPASTLPGGLGVDDVVLAAGARVWA